jgi:hypothetical protein
VQKFELTGRPTDKRVDLDQHFAWSERSRCRSPRPVCPNQTRFGARLKSSFGPLPTSPVGPPVSAFRVEQTKVRCGRNVGL